MALNVISRTCAIPRSSLLLEKKIVVISSKAYSTDGEEFYRKLDSTNLRATKRGTGYRSSFNGIVCTVFGSTGFVGRHLMNRLGKYGTQVVCGYRTSYYADQCKVHFDLGQLVFSHYDIRDMDSLRKAVKYSDVAVNLVGKDYDTVNYTLEETHIEGARRIARACKEMGVKKLIHVSTMNASPNPEPLEIQTGSRFLRSKWNGEQAVLEEFPDAVIVRPSEIFGEEDRFIDYYGNIVHTLNRKVFLYKAGKETIKQPVYVQDVSEGLYQLVARPNDEVAGKIYQFVGPKRYYLHDLVRFFFDVIRKDRDIFGLEIDDSRTSLLFHAYMLYRDKVYRETTDVGMTWERFERINTTDKLDKNGHFLSDLIGPNMFDFESNLDMMTKHVRNEPYYADEVGEYELPPSPPAAP